MLISNTSNHSQLLNSSTCIEWIVGNFIIVSLDDYGEYIYNIKDYNTCLSLLSQIPSTVDSRAVTYMAMFVSDYDGFVGYYHKILLLRDRNPFVGGIPSVITYVLQMVCMYTNFPEGAFV